MKLSRIENDLQWNYGIKFCRSSYRMDGYELHIWLFKQDKIPQPEEMVRVSKGFMFHVDFSLSDRIYSFRLPRIRARIM